MRIDVLRAHVIARCLLAMDRVRAVRLPRWAYFMCAIAASCVIVVASAAPYFWKQKTLVDKSDSLAEEVRQQSNILSQKIEAQEALLALKQKEKEAKERASLGIAYSREAHIESRIRYWRKQFEAYGLMTGMALTISGRGDSKYEKAIRLNLLLRGKDSNAVPVSQLLKALDFLQLYGYLESYENGEAVLHARL